MANREIKKVPIYSEGIKQKMQKAGYSIRRLAKETGYGDRTIRNYLEQEEMPPEMLSDIDNVLRPKRNPVRVHLDLTVNLADSDLENYAYQILSIGDPTLDELELDEYETEDILMYITGKCGYQINSVTVPVSDFKKYLDPVNREGGF